MAIENIIDSITIKLGKKTIVLSTEEAQKLKSALDGLFGKEVVKEVVHEHHYPYWQWSWPQVRYTYDSSLTTAQYSSGNVSLSL